MLPQFQVIVTAALLFQQDFQPAMPPGVPAVNGPVVERFALRHIDVEAGSGAVAAAGQRYKVHYTGWLRDGKKFDSSRDRNEPFQFVQGRRQVIAGWEAGFEGMRVGGRRRLFIPYQLAYGEKGSGSTIPPRAELIFDVELLGVEDVPEAVPAAEVLKPLEEL
jgi:peptidylprolyl isomerase